MPTCEQFLRCGGADLPSSAAGPVIPLRLRGPDMNLRLRIEEIAESVCSSVPDELADLLEVATYVYVADQAVRRGPDTDPGMGACWRRHLHFVVPVRCLKLWKSPAVRSALVQTLSFLSEDQYTFTFQPYQGPIPQATRYFQFGASWPEGPIDEVCLFSGGLDGLAGAAEAALVHRRRVLMVHHRSNPKREPQVKGLVSRLCQKARGNRPLYLPVRINKQKGLSRETTQRTRSFLFAGLAAVVARLAGLNSLSFYENGIVGLNLPFATQLVGVRASRTTHPRFIRSMAAFLSHLLGEPFKITNPYVGLTKADVLRRLDGAGCADLIHQTVSCSHPRRSSTQTPHCGACLQCVIRRFGVLAAGLEAHDPAEGYETDLLTGPRDEWRSRTLLAALTETANQLREMNPGTFSGRFGEGARLPWGLDHPAPTVGAEVHELYRRHGQEVAGVVRRAVQDNADALLARTLPATCLVRLAVTPSVPPPAPVRPTAANIFRRQGEAWMVRFDGGPDRILIASVGAAYLHLLIQAQGKSISAAALMASVAQCPDRFGLGSCGELADRQAVSAYRERYSELTAEICQAQENHDVGRQEQLQREWEALAAEIARITGLGGRQRQAKNDRENVRKAVWSAVNRTLEKIRQYAPELADHLVDPTLTLGWNPSYRPVPPLEWET